MEMETTQIKGIDSTNRITRGDLKDGATLEVREKIMTHGKQYAKTDFHVDSRKGFQHQYRTLS